MKYGPVDVLIVATGEPKFDGTIVTELNKLTTAGTIRLLDAMLLAKSPQGMRLSLNIEDLPDADRAALGHIETDTRGLFDAGDEEVLFEGMVPGSAILALAIEHTWARDLVNSMYEAGAEVAVNYRIPAVMVEDAIAEAAAANK